jgi:DNA end-binding protein Ku
MAPLWKGALSFGLVNIPVRLHSAVQAGEGTVHFRQLHKKDLAPIRNDHVCTAEDKTVPWGEIVKGYEYAKEKFVVLTADEIKAAAPEASQTIDILDFVKEEEIDPRYFDTPYYFVPEKNGAKAYALLRDAIHRSELVGIAKFTLRQKQHLAGIKAVGDALVLETMRFAHELVDLSEITFPKADASKVTAQEMRMAQQLIEALSASWEPDKYRDDYRAHLLTTIQAKLKGKKITAVKERAPKETKVLDLMSKLRASLDQRPKTAKAKRATRKTAASRRSA